MGAASFYAPGWGYVVADSSILAELGSFLDQHYGNWTGPGFSGGSTSAAFQKLSDLQLKTPGIDDFDDLASRPHDIAQDQAQQILKTAWGAPGADHVALMTQYAMRITASDQQFYVDAAHAHSDSLFGELLRDVSFGVFETIDAFNASFIQRMNTDPAYAAMIAAMTESQMEAFATQLYQKANLISFGADRVFSQEGAFAVADALSAQVATLLAGDNLPLSFVAQSFSHAVWNSIDGKLTSYQIGGHPLNNTDAFAADLIGNLTSAVGQFGGSQLGAELFKALGLSSDIGAMSGGVLGGVAANQLTALVARDFFGFSQGFGLHLENNIVELPDFGAGLLESGLGAVGSFLGSSLSHLIADRVGPGSAIGGAIGAAIGSFFPVFGTAVGSFLGSLIGGLFGGHPSVGPNASAWYEYSQAEHQFIVTGSTVDNGGDRKLAQDLAHAGADTVNEILQIVGGTVLTSSSSPIPKTFGYIQGKFFVVDGETYARTDYPHQFADASAAVTYGVIQTLHSIHIAGGDPIMKRALANSDATTIQGVIADLNTAHDYELYLDNPALFNIGLQNLTDPTNPFNSHSVLESPAFTWSVELARAQALHLDRPAASDLYGITPVYSRIAVPFGNVDNNAVLVFDMDGSGIKLTSREQHAVSFDRDADGFFKQTDWIGASNALLVLDVNGDGIINDTTEIVGTHFRGYHFTSGLAALQSLDSNGDRKIDIADDYYGSMSFWIDANQNGRVDLGELKSVIEENAAALNLDLIFGVSPGEDLSKVKPGPVRVTVDHTDTGSYSMGFRQVTGFDGVTSLQFEDIYLADSPNGSKLVAYEGHPGWTKIVFQLGGSILLAPSGGSGWLTLDNASGQYIVGSNLGNLITITGNNNQINGGMLIDRLSVSGNLNRLIAGDGPVATLTAQGNENLLQGGAGADTLTATGSGNLIYAGSGDSTLSLIGTGGLLQGGAGTDVLTAVGRSNKLVAGSGHNDLVAIGDGNELQGGSAADSLTAIGDHNHLAAGSGGAVLSAQGSDNLLVGGSASDTLRATGIQNFLTGGPGDDRFVFALGDGNDTVTDFAAGIHTDDRVDLTAFHATFADVLAHASQSGANTVFNFGGGDTLTLQNVVKTGLSAEDFAGLKVTQSDFSANGHSGILWARDNGTVSIWDDGQIGGAHWIANPGAVSNSWHIAGRGDFDGNGHNDVLWRNDNGSVSIWDNGAIGSAHIISGPGVVPNSWHISGTGDFDGNGQSDILWRNDNGAASIWDNGDINQAHIIANAGSIPGGWSIAGTGDFDGNGQSDILWHRDDGTVAIWDNGQIAGAHWIANAGVVPNSWHIAGTGDFDGNGHDDILWRNDNGAVSIWDNGQIGSAHIIANAGVVANSWHISETGDFDGNGHSDILWHNDSGATSIWDNGQIGAAHIIANAGVVPNDWHIV